MKKVIVLGSVNMDMVMLTDRLPEIGETLLGETIDYYVGGKGANQAVAAARFGAATALIGKVGADIFGIKAYDHLKKEQIDMTAVTKEKTSATGVASIFKLQTDNAIVVLPGANRLLTDGGALVADKISSGDIFLTQLEIPLPTVLEGLKKAKEKGATTILNPAPYHEKVLELLPYVDYITPNETEFAGMTGTIFETGAQLEAAMLTWARTHRTHLIVTRGAAGTSYTTASGVVTVPAEKVQVVDTTGAGDTFNGIFAAALAAGQALATAVALAGAGATLSVTKLGAQTGMPTQAEVAGLRHF